MATSVPETPEGTSPTSNPTVGEGKTGPETTNPDLSQLFSNKHNLANVLAWTVKPLPEVGVNATPINAMPSYDDTASQSGLKGQAFTTWNCTGRSIIIGAVQADSARVRSLSKPVRQASATPDLGRVTNNPEVAKEFVKLTPKQEQMLKAGTMVFHLSTRTLYRTSEYEQVKSTLDLAAEVVEGFELVKKETEGGTSQPVKDKIKWTKYTYSDMIPIRTVQPTSWPMETDQGHGVPYTNFFTSLMNRLADPNTTAPLMSVVRGPSVRDAPSIMGLVRTLANLSETAKESAAMLRALCLACAWDKHAYECDPTVLKWIRGVSPTGALARSFHWGAKTDYPDGKIVAVPFDIAVTLGMNKRTVTHLPDFPFEGMDVDWTMVPVSSKFLTNRASFIYVLSFLDSAYWNGRLNYWRDVIWVEGTKLRDGAITTMPNCNSVRIPGPKSVMLVLLDATAQGIAATLSLGALRPAIQIYNGTRAVAPTSMRDLWENYWNGQYEGNFIMGDAVSAFNEICATLGVSDACGRALSLASELFLGNHPGVALPADIHHNNYRRDTSYGAWALKGDTYIDPGDNNIIAEEYPEFDVAGAEAGSPRQKLVGFNFGVQTPYHVSPTSATKITYHLNSPDPHVVDYSWIEGYWSVNGYDAPIMYHRPRYSVYTCSSMMRLSIAVGLVSVHEQSYQFKTGPGAANWINMLGVAVALSTANMLATNDLDLRTWTGWPKTDDRNNMYTHYSNCMIAATAGSVKWVEMRSVTEGTPDWAWNQIEQYWDMSPVNDPNWASNSNWPIHAIHQWMQKLDLAPAVPHPKYDNFVADDATYHFGIREEPAYAQWNGVFSSTIDFARYAPVVYVKEVGRAERYSMMWVDRWNHDSSFNLARNGDYKFFTSTFPIRAVEERWFNTVRKNLYLIIDSRGAVNGDESRLLRTSKIMYPDPPIWQTFLRLARDYLLIPGWEGLKHFLSTGEVLPAVAKAGSKVVEQLQSDIQRRKEEAETEKKVEEAMGHPREAPDVAALQAAAP